MAGVDVVAHDIGRPLEEQEGVVVEVDAEPRLVHLEPAEGPARPVAEAIVAPSSRPEKTAGSRRGRHRRQRQDDHDSA